jgi:hypothetical protein
MVRAAEIGDKLLSAVLLLKANSVNDFDLSFWEDPETVEDPADLTGVAVSLELTPSGGTPVSFSATVATNKATWHLSDTQSNFSWSYATYRVLFTKLAEVDVVVAGPVRIQP